MIAANLSFVAGHWVRKQVVDSHRPIGTLLVNRLSSKNLGRSAILLASDPSGAISIEEESGLPPTKSHDGTIRLRLSDGRLVTGQLAFLIVAKRLPWFTPLGVIGRILGIRSSSELGKIPQPQQPSRSDGAVYKGTEAKRQVYSNGQPTSVVSRLS